MTIAIPFPNDRRLTLSLPSLVALTRIWTGFELAVTLLLLHKGLWSDYPRGKLIAIGVIWISACNILDCRLGLYSRQKMGLVWDNSNQFSGMVLLALFSAGGILFSGLLFGTTRGDYLGRFFGSAGYLVGAMFQRYLENFFLVRFEKTAGNWFPLATSILFCLAHLPNKKLMVIAFFGEYASASLFDGYRNIWPFMAAHAILGAALSAFWRMNMKVGIGFLRSSKT